MFSANLAEECSTFITSFVVDADVIPRLSKESLEILRNDILEMIARIKVPKYQVLKLLRFPKTRYCEDSLGTENANMLHDKDHVFSSEFGRKMEQFFSFQESLKRKNAAKYIELFIPGETVQLFGGGNTAGTTRDVTGMVNEVDAYTARWAKRDDFRRILISSHMMKDHNPANVRRVILDIASSQFGLEPPYSPIDLDGDVDEVASC